MPSTDPVDLSSLEHASFRIVRRGFETSSVRDLLARAAAEIAELRRTGDELRARLAEATEALSGSGTGLLEAHRVASALGVEASQVLEAAHVAATERAERAEREAADVAEEASAAADQLRESANAEADSLRAEGAARRDEIIAAAEREAARILEDTRRQGRDMVQEAQTVRERMLRDLSRKRHSGRAQVEQLRAGRDRLLESLSAVQDNLDSALGDLVASVPEARKAAEWAGLRISEQPDPTPSELEAEIETARLVDLPLAQPADAPYDHDADDEPDADDADEADLSEMSDLDAALEPAESTPPAEAGPPDGGPAADTAEPGPEVAADPLAAVPRDAGTTGGSDAAETSDTDAVHESAVSETAEEREAAEPSSSSTDAGDDIFARLRSAEAEAVAATAPIAAAKKKADAAKKTVAKPRGPAKRGAKRSADRRSGRAVARPHDDSTEEVDRAGAPEPEESGRRGPGQSAPDESETVADPTEAAPTAAAARKDAAESATRALKKVLVDEQSSLLHRIRSQGSEAISELLGSSERRTAYHDVLAQELSELAESLGSPASLDASDAAGLFDELALAPVDHRLRGLIESGAESDELAAAVRSLYRESRSRRIAEAVDAALDAMASADAAREGAVPPDARERAVPAAPEGR